MDREKVIKEFEHLLNAAKGDYQDFVDLTVDGGDEILALLKEQDEKNKELQNAYNYLQRQFFEVQDKLLKEQETKLICNLLGGEPYEVYCKECRMVICRLGKGDDMNTVKGIFTHCPNCGRLVKWE